MKARGGGRRAEEGIVDVINSTKSRHFLALNYRSTNIDAMENTNPIAPVKIIIQLIIPIIPKLSPEKC